MVAPPIYRDPLDGTEMVRVLKDGRFYMAPLSAVAAVILAPALARIAALEVGGAAQVARDAGQDAALAQEAVARQAIAASVSTEAAARAAVDTAQGARLAALEAKPEEVAHFTASAKLPALSVLAPVTLTLTGLVPARAGDVLKAGETITVEPAAPLPAGINIAAAIVTADGTVSLQLTASLSVTAGAAAIVWNISALR